MWLVRRIAYFMTDVIPVPGIFCFSGEIWHFMVKGINMVSWLSVFSTTLLLRILPFWADFPLSSSWWAVGAGVWRSLFSIDRWECLHPCLAVVRNSLPTSGSLGVVNYVGPPLILSSLKGSASYSSVRLRSESNQFILCNCARVRLSSSLQTSSNGCPKLFDNLGG